MSIQFGHNSSNSNSSFNGTGTFNQTENGSQTPLNPDWVNSLGQGFGGQIAAMSNWNPSQFVAGPSGLQTQAAQGASGLWTGGNSPSSGFGFTGAPQVASAPVAPPLTDHAISVPAGTLGTTPKTDGSAPPVSPPASMAPAVQPPAPQAAAPPATQPTPVQGPVMGAGDRAAVSQMDPGDIGKPVGGVQAPNVSASGVSPTNGSVFSAAIDKTLNPADQTAQQLQNVAQTKVPIINGLYQKSLPQVSGTSASDSIQKYMDPALQDELNSTLNSFDNQAGQTRAQDDLAMAGSGAFGGSGAAVQKSLTEGQLGLARGQLEAGLRSNAFNTALGAAQSDADRAQQAAQLNAQLEEARQSANQNQWATVGTANAANALSDKGLNINAYGNAGGQYLGEAGQLTNTGATANGVADNNLMTQYGIGSGLQQIGQAQAQAPLTYEQYLSSLYGNLPLSLFHGVSQTDNTSGTQTQSGTQSGSGSSNGFGFGWSSH